MFTLPLTTGVNVIVSVCSKTFEKMAVTASSSFLALIQPMPNVSPPLIFINE